MDTEGAVESVRAVVGPGCCVEAAVLGFGVGFGDVVAADKYELSAYISQIRYRRFDMPSLLIRSDVMPLQDLREMLVSRATDSFSFQRYQDDFARILVEKLVASV